MDKKKKNILIGIAIGVIAILLGVIACLGIFRGFSAEKYVAAVLDQNMKGDVKASVSMTKGLTEKAANAQYEVLVTDVLKNVIISGLPLDEEQEKECVKICKKILAGMQYDVQEAKKISDKEYQVPVKIKKSDVLTKLQALATTENARINSKVENGGEYRGTMEEIEQQMQAEFAGNLSAMLEEAYNTMEFGEEETIILTVKKGENGLYTLDGTEIGGFITKIMGSNENQD